MCDSLATESLKPLFCFLCCDNSMCLSYAPDWHHSVPQWNFGFHYTWKSQPLPTDGHLASWTPRVATAYPLSIQILLGLEAHRRDQLSQLAFQWVPLTHPQKSPFLSTDSRDSPQSDFEILSSPVLALIRPFFVVYFLCVYTYDRIKTMT